MRSFIRSLLPSCAVILLGSGVGWSATDGFRALTEEGARRLNVSENQPEMPLLLLEDMNGDEVRLGRNTNTADKITLIEFIYATCPTICQIAGSEFAKLRDRLAQTGLGDHVRLISVSFDPLHDRPEELRGYAENHGAEGVIWTIARVQPGDLGLMKRSFGLRVIPDGMGGYQHNAAIHLIDRSGRLTAIFNIGDINEIFDVVRSTSR